MENLSADHAPNPNPHPKPKPNSNPNSNPYPNPDVCVDSDDGSTIDSASENVNINANTSITRRTSLHIHNSGKHKNPLLSPRTTLASSTTKETSNRQPLQGIGNRQTTKTF